MTVVSPVEAKVCDPELVVALQTLSCFFRKTDTPGPSRVPTTRILNGQSVTDAALNVLRAAGLFLEE